MAKKMNTFYRSFKYYVDVDIRKKKSPRLLRRSKVLNTYLFVYVVIWTLSLTRFKLYKIINTTPMNDRTSKYIKYDVAKYIFYVNSIRLSYVYLNVIRVLRRCYDFFSVFSTIVIFLQTFTTA